MVKKQIRNEQGFSVVEVLIVIVIVAALAFVGYRVLGAQDEGEKKDHQEASHMEKQPATDEPLALQNFGVDLANVSFDQNATREYESMGLKGFYPFGDELGGKDDVRKNPNFEFASLKAGTKVVSAIDGVVAFIKEQPETGDTEVFIQPSEGSAWTVGYDHLTKVAVKKGAMVKAGDVLGEPAKQGNGLLRFEIQINKDADGTTTHHCPSTLLASGVKDSLLKNLGEMQNTWEMTTGLELYDLTKQDPVGCLAKTMTAAEAEGR